MIYVRTNGFCRRFRPRQSPGFGLLDALAPQDTFSTARESQLESREEVPPLKGVATVTLGSFLWDKQKQPTGQSFKQANIGQFALGLQEPP